MHTAIITPREARLCAGIALVGLAAFLGLAWLLTATPFADVLLERQPLGVALGVLAGQAALATLTTLALWIWHLAHRRVGAPPAAHKAHITSSLPAPERM